MTQILPAIFSNAFCWMRTSYFHLFFTDVCFSGPNELALFKLMAWQQNSDTIKKFMKCAFFLTDEFMIFMCWPPLYPCTLQWRYNGHDGISNHQPHDCLLNRVFRCRSKKTSKLRVTGLCAGNSPVAGEFPAQMASNVENVSIWWRHHEYTARWSTNVSVLT